MLKVALLQWRPLSHIAIVLSRTDAEVLAKIRELHLPEPPAG
jgi:hypothetical protein